MLDLKYLVGYWFYDTKYYLIFKHIDILVFQFQNLLPWNSCTSYGIEKMCRIYHHLFWKYKKVEIPTKFPTLLIISCMRFHIVQHSPKPILTKWVPSEDEQTIAYHHYSYYYNSCTTFQVCYTELNSAHW